MLEAILQRPVWGDKLITGDEERVISPLVALEGSEHLPTSHCFFMVERPET